MALRVLLADESTTIKKVMQLALQDFAVEVKAVHVGVDVAEVAKTLKPDIIFADILLQKKNGYEVCIDLKNDQTLRKIPVVLMWSSFMDLDETLAQQSGAENRLEKPFDVEILRNLIFELVPRTRTQKLAPHLSFPENITEPLRDEENAKRSASTLSVAHPKSTPAREEKTVTHAPPQASSGTARSGWTMDSFQDISEFAEDSQSPSLVIDDLNETKESTDEELSEFQLTHLTAKTPPPIRGSKSEPFAPPPDPTSESLPGDDSDPWSHQDLSRFKLNLTPISVENEEIGISLQLDEGELGSYSAKPTQEPKNVAPPTPLNNDSIAADKSPFELDFESIAQDPNIEEIPYQENASIGDEDIEFEVYEEVKMVEPDEDFEEPVPIGPVATQSSAPRRKIAADEHELLPAGAIPQLTAERLEEIIRSQSRDIIESVVRKIVPDIASALIKQELNRLLEENTNPGQPKRESRQ